MNKSKINYVVDVLLLISFIIVVITCLVLFFAFPDYLRQGGFPLILGLSKRSWQNLHTIFGFVMIGLSLIHVILHFNFFLLFKNIFSKK